MAGDGRGGERGTALTMAVVLVVVLAGVSLGMITVSAAESRRIEASRLRQERFCLAEAGLALGLADLHAGGDGCIGVTAPLELGGGTVTVTTADLGDGTLAVISVGTVGGASRALRTVLQSSGGVFHHAIFVGNSSGDPAYSLEVGGSGEEADLISGDVYSGGGVIVEGDAEVTGEIRATGSIVGATGTEGFSQPIPDLAAADYETNHDIDVAGQFEAHAVAESSVNGGTGGYKVPEDYASHIFRLNPTDRATECQSTAKNDYFLEDPYESVNRDLWPVTLSGLTGESGEPSNGKVFFVDGNLWLHSKSTFGFQTDHTEEAGVQVTFVVKGNVYFCDNFELEQPAKDGVAFVALKDPAVPDSGNIYFGDPRFGTLLRVDAFMYAENNFYDSNLDETGSMVIELNGMMSAGNQVLVERDASGHHTRMVLNFDQRVMDGSLSLPGVPALAGSDEKASLTEVYTSEVSPDGSGTP